MTVRPVHPRWAVLAVLASGCVGVTQLRSSADIIKSELDRVERAGGRRCAPVELATGQAHLRFVQGELDQGNAARAQEHLQVAEAARAQAKEKMKDCERPQKVVVKIEEADSDGDGVGDAQDGCPRLPGTAENRGCPLEAPRDRDGDGVPDPSDRCPDQKEDVDGFEDFDGCPELDNDADGVTDSVDRCPLQSGPVQNLGCPVTDKDGDGVSDDKDVCPAEPEDRDGFKDEDGCPDLDDDGDGVPDSADRCPRAAEDRDGHQDEDGCPDPDNDGDGVTDEKDDCPNQFGLAEAKGCPKKYALVTVTPQRIELRKQIRFATNSAKIVGSDSQAILAEVAQVLKDLPRIKKVRVEGHTDSQGDDARNLRLSQGRADSVKAGLLRLGVDPARLEAVGYGETRPIASNATQSGRAENRRTEFNIVEQ